ncbi:putative non-specific serine/threonine protein kinase [Helianthus annuus]|nr:putative non-specific serine/threonine protein kinase [Helianthus annuus]
MLSSTNLKLNSTFISFSPTKPTSPTHLPLHSPHFKRHPQKLNVSFNQISDDLLENTLHLDQFPVFKTGYDQFQQVTSDFPEVEKWGYDQFQQVTSDFPEVEKWGVFVFAGLVWVYLTARPGVLIGAIDAYVLGPAQKVFDGLSGRRNLKSSDFLIGDKLGEGSFGVVYSGVVVPKNMTVEERVRNSGSRRKQLEKDPRFKEKVILKQVKS